MTTIIALSGSLRARSYNTALLRAAQELAPSGVTIEIASIRDFPLYDGDLETAAFPKVVTDLKDRIGNSAGLLLATPEYNHSVPGTLKNAIDWLSRPSADIARVFGNRPVAFMGASEGEGGTGLAQVAWLPVLHTLRTRPYFGGRLQVGNAPKVFDGDLKLTDEKVKKQLTKLLEGFAAFIQNK
jgi:NAD(P)H-dependent FMN reductase